MGLLEGGRFEGPVAEPFQPWAGDGLGQHLMHALAPNPLLRSAWLAVPYSAA